MTTPVNFELAKLLKEKGFDEKCSQIYYDGTNEIRGHSHFLYSRDIKAPTIAEVVMWLYEKHGVWIWVERYSKLFRPYAEELGYETFGKWEGHKYTTPHEAYEAAIEYTLKHLI